MNWFHALQAISSTAEWGRRADLRNMLLGIQESAHEAMACILRDDVGTFSFRQFSEAMEEMEGHCEAVQKWKSTLESNEHINQGDK